MAILGALRTILSERKAGDHAKRGLDLEKRGERDAAIAAFRDGVEAAPSSATAHYLLGRALADAGRDADAIPSLRQALACEPDHVDAMRAAGPVLVNLGRFDEAIANDRRLMQLDPAEFEVHLRLGRSLQATGKMDEAAAAYRQALSMQPRDVAANVSLAAVLRATGKPFAGIPHLFRAADAAPGDDAIMKILKWPITIGVAGIEIMSLFIRNFVLAVRLFANMVGGHAALAMILLFIQIAGKAAAPLCWRQRRTWDAAFIDCWTIVARPNATRCC